MGWSTWPTPQAEDEKERKKKKKKGPSEEAEEEEPDESMLSLSGKLKCGYCDPGCSFLPV